MPGFYGQVLHLQDGIPRIHVLLFNNEIHFPANHHFRHCFLGSLRHIDGPNIFPFAQNAAPVRHFLDLI